MTINLKATHFEDQANLEFALSEVRRQDLYYLLLAHGVDDLPEDAPKEKMIRRIMDLNEEGEMVTLVSLGDNFVAPKFHGVETYVDPLEGRIKIMRPKLVSGEFMPDVVKKEKVKKIVKKV